MHVTRLIALSFFLAAWPSLAAAQFIRAYHPETGEGAVVTLMLGQSRVAMGHGRGPGAAPVLAVFPSGRVIWSTDYFSAEYLQGGRHLSREERQQVQALVNERRRQIDETIPEDHPRRLWVRLGHYDHDPELEELRRLLRGIEYYEGKVDEETIVNMLEELRRTGFFSHPGGRRFGPRQEGIHSPGGISLSVAHQELYQSMSGPLGYYFMEAGPSPRWDDSLPETVNWSRLVGYILKVVEKVDPETIVTYPGTLLDHETIPYRNFDPEDIRLVFPEQNALPDAMTPSSKLVETALQIAEEDADEAVQYLRAALPVLPDDEQYLAVRALGYLEMRRGNREQAREAFRRIANREIEADPVTLAEANIRKGYFISETTNASLAISYFARVATGAVPATQEQVEEASYRMARLFHRQRRGLYAIEVLSQLLDNAADPVRKRNARLQLTGLLFEAGKGEFGSVTDAEKQEFLEQTRAEAELLITDPDVETRIRVIAELMHFETFAFEEDGYAESLAGALEFLDKWTTWRDENPERVNWNINTHLSTAHGWALLCAFRLSEYELAVDLAREIRELYDEDDPYEAFNVFGYSLLYEAFAQEALGNYEMGEQLRAQCREEQRDWYETIGLRRAERYDLSHSLREE